MHAWWSFLEQESSSTQRGAHSPSQCRRAMLMAVLRDRFSSEPWQEYMSGGSLNTRLWGKPHDTVTNHERMAWALDTAEVPSHDQILM